MYKIVLDQYNGDVLDYRVTIYGFLFNIGFGLSHYLKSNDSMYSCEIIGMYRTTAKTFFKCLFNSFDIQRIAEWGSRPW